MGGPARKHAVAEKKPAGSSSGGSSASRDPTQRSAPKSIPRLDGNRDPTIHGVLEYTRPTDLKNISEFLGLAGWYAARGVSTNIFPPQPACAWPHHFPLTVLVCKKDHGSMPIWRRSVVSWMQIQLWSAPLIPPFLLPYSSLPFILPSFIPLVHYLYPPLSLLVVMATPSKLFQNLKA